MLKSLFKNTPSVQYNSMCSHFISIQIPIVAMDKSFVVVIFQDSHVY